MKTFQALCILAEDEITLHRTFALSEIGCKKAESDQSTLVVIPSAMYRKQIFLVIKIELILLLLY